MRRICIATALTMAVFLIARPVWATNAEDFKIYQLGDPSSDPTADTKFRLFANQLGIAISGFNFSPAQTLGHSGFAISLEYGVSKINPDYWPRYGTSDSPYLLMPSLHLRKGLGLSFELGGRLTYLQESSMFAGTLELKWALNEGFTYAPDFAVRGHVTTLAGATDFDMTTGGVDIGIGKQFGIGGVVTLTPYIGWNLIFVHATARMIDFQPSRAPEEAMAQPFETLNFYQEVKAGDNVSHRFYGGLRFVLMPVEIGLEFSYTKVSVDHEIEGLDKEIPVMNFGAKLGVDF
ncbi:MAG: hypothetical protein LBM75_03290 [Myxococcales bacterium]|jgi:hypothetical protein|nr:hypothetical protein [Myxococcales bacterium]